MTKKTTILAIDTATGPCSVAVWKDGVVAAYLENIKPAQQSACLMTLVEDALKQAGIRYDELTHVACTVGPGSFTGIRVGLAAARGICFAANIEGLGYTTLDVLAYGARECAQPVLAVLNAGKGECYYQAANGPELGTLEAALANPHSTVAGNMQASIAAITFPRADALAALAASNTIRPLPLNPFYIRDPDAKPMAVDR